LVVKDVEGMKFKDIIKKQKKEATLIKDTDLLKRFWGNDKELDQTDKFLRNYILMEGWKDKGVRAKYEKEL